MSVVTEQDVLDAFGVTREDIDLDGYRQAREAALAEREAFLRWVDEVRAVTVAAYEVWSALLLDLFETDPEGAETLLDYTGEQDAKRLGIA